MEIAGVPHATQTVNATSSDENAVANKLLKKELDMQQQTAAQLIQSVPDPDSNVGHHVDITV